MRFSRTPLIITIVMFVALYMAAARRAPNEVYVGLVILWLAILFGVNRQIHGT